MDPDDLPIEKIVHAYRNEGASMYAIAQKHEISPGLVRRLLGDNGVTLRTGYPRQEFVAAVVAEDGDAIERRYRNGESAASLAAAYGVSPGTLRRILADRGIPRRGIAEARRLRAQQQRQRRQRQPSTPARRSWDGSARDGVPLAAGTWERPGETDPGAPTPTGRKEVTTMGDPVNGHDVGGDEIVTLPDEDEDDKQGNDDGQ